MNKNLFQLQCPMTSTILPVDLELTKHLNFKDKSSKRKFIIDYDRRIGLRGGWFYYKKLFGTRLIWTGKELLDENLCKFDSDISLICPKLFPLDGYLIDGVYVVVDSPLKRSCFKDRYLLLKKNKCFKHEKLKLHEIYYVKNINIEFFKINDFYKKNLDTMLIHENSMYESKESEKFIHYKERIKGKAKIIELREGMFKYYGFLGKFKCQTDNGKTFYCSKDIPDHIRKNYIFKRKKLIRIIDSSLPMIGDMIEYTTNYMIKNDKVPQDPHFVNFNKIF